MDGLYVVGHEPTWCEEPEPDDEYDNGMDEKTLYALFGLAIYKANCLETLAFEVCSCWSERDSEPFSLVHCHTPGPLREPLWMAPDESE